MAPKADYVPNSDEERSQRGRTSSIASKSIGTSKKRRASRSPAPPTQRNRQKTQPARAKSGSSQSVAVKVVKPKVAPSVEEQSAKNAESRKSTMDKRQEKPPKQELMETIERIKNTKSAAYRTFEDPKLIKPRVKGAKVKYHGFRCKTCGEIIQRKVGTMETSSLLKHQNRCELRRHQGVLSEYGITGGGGPPSMYDVRQYVAQWVSEDGRPFAIIYDRFLRKLFPREILDLLPCSSTIPKDVMTVYTMTQNVIRTMLAGITGVFHIALDMYQSTNGLDFLGLVLFHPAIKDNTMYIERFVLECLSFSGKHTGVALANTVYGILKRFKIEDRVWGVVCDNASNNADMMNQFKKFKMHRLTGPEARIHCFPHIMNIASKAIATPFLQKRAELEKAPAAPRKLREPDELDIPLSDEEIDEEPEGTDADEDDNDSIPEEFDPNEEDETGDDDGTAPSRSLDPDPNDEADMDLSDIEIPELIAGSTSAKELKGARKGLFKMAWLARKLRFSPNFRREFQEICELLEMTGPHNIPRDVVTRWNSTKGMIEHALRLEPAIVQFQKDPKYPAERRLTNKEFKAMRVLLKLLNPLSVLTEIMSRSKLPMLADILVHFDGLNQVYCNMAKDDSLPLWAKRAANFARLKLDKYYGITDTSIMYRLATLFHPSNRLAYLKKLDWQPEWIQDAHAIALSTWEKFYKPLDYDNGSEDTTSQSQFGYSTFAEELYGSFAEDNDKPVDPLTDFIDGKPTLEKSKSGKSKPVNPLNWWYAQRLAGEEHDGLTQMALDILTAPASSVEVERAFSFVSNLVSKRRHTMSAYTIQSTATLGAYSRADLVPTGILAKAHKKARERNQANARAKVAEAQAKAAAAEAAALAAEQERSGDEMTDGGETEDDEDVLEPTSEVEDCDLEDD